MAAQEMVNVLCMKWGTKYSADYVNTLYSMVARNMSRDFRFVCLTEDGVGLHENVEVFPLPELSVDLGGPERGWNKLAVFAETLYDLSGKVLAEFEKSFDTIKKTHRNEQEYLSAAMMAKNALVYWPDHWCRSFKRHCIKPLSFFMARETEMPEDCRVLVFHGKPDPHEAIAGVSGKWYRRFKPATWVSKHWH